MITTLKGYARHRDVTPAAVRRAITSGRIKAKTAKINSRGWWEIDQWQADKEWDANTDAVKQAAAMTGRKKPGEEPPPDDDEPVEIIDGVPVPKSSVSNARMAFFKSQKAKIELDLLKGRTIDRAKADAENFKVMRIVRDKILNVPEQTAAQLAAMSDPEEVYAKLMLDLRTALEELTDVDD